MPKVSVVTIRDVPHLRLVGQNGEVRTVPLRPVAARAEEGAAAPIRGFS